MPAVKPRKSIQKFKSNWRKMYHFLFCSTFSTSLIDMTTPMPPRNRAGFLTVTKQESGFLVTTLAFLLSFNTKFDTDGTQYPIIFQKGAPEMWYHLKLLSTLFPELMDFCWERQSWRWNSLMMLHMGSLSTLGILGIFSTLIITIHHPQQKKQKQTKHKDIWVLRKVYVSFLRKETLQS